MSNFLSKKRGQSTAEYAVLIALVVAAVVGMQTYVKRGLQARMKDAGDDYITALGATKQYEHTKISSQSTHEVLVGSYEDSKMDAGGILTRESAEKTKQATGDYRQYDYTKE
jgi:Flp pilus assembly pilin Flp